MAPLRCSPIVVPLSPFSSPSPFSLSSPTQDSSHPYRVLEVETVTGGNTAPAKLWVYRGEKLVGKVDNVRGPNSAWNPKFVFAVTDDFLCDEDSSLFLDIYSRPILGIARRKKYVGTARCCIKNALMGIEGDDKGTGGDVACCTVPVLDGVELKLRLWKELLQYMAPVN